MVMVFHGTNPVTKDRQKNTSKLKTGDFFCPTLQGSLHETNPNNARNPSKLLYICIKFDSPQNVWHLMTPDFAGGWSRPISTFAPPEVPG